MNLNRTYAEDFLGEMSPAGQRVQQTLSPYQQFRVSGSVVPPDQDVGIGDPVAEYEALDPADDSFLEKQAVLFQAAPDLLRSPNVQQKVRQGAALHAEAQEYFKKDPSLIDFYLSQRGSNVPPAVAIGELRKRAQDSSLKEQFLKSGGILSEFESLRDPATGAVDRFAAMDYLNKADRASKVKAASAPKELSPDAYSRIDKARSDTEALMSLANDPSRLGAYFKDKTKKEMMGDKVDRTDEALKMVNDELRSARDNYDRLLQSYGRNYVIPPEFGSTEPVQVQESVTTESTNPSPTGDRESANAFLSRLKKKL